MVMMVAVPRRVVIIVMMLPMRRYAESIPIMLHRHMHASSEPSEQRQGRDELMEKFHERGFCTGTAGESRRMSPSSDTKRRRSAFAMTETELRLMAAPATMGLRSRPNTG